MQAVSALDSATMFTCKKFNTTMLKSVCIRRQTKGVQYSHDTPVKTIPDGCRDCEQGKNIKDSKEVKVMRRRGICTNCERPKMALFSPDDICGSCNTAKNEAQPGKEKEALAAAREKYRGKPKLRMGRQTKVGRVPFDKHQSGAGAKSSRKPGADEVEGKPQNDKQYQSREIIIPHDDTIPQSVPDTTHCQHITLKFENYEDEKIYKAIKAAAKRQRRTPEQQILWICQCELIKEATA